MKRVAVLMLVAFASCKTSIDFEQGRPYSCTPDAGDDQRVCGPGWRCGLEARCHAIGDAKPWACRVNTDCEANWVCGLEKTCHDPTVVDDYLCETDTDCVAPYRCGYAGFCLDANAELSVTTPVSPEQLTVLGPRFFTGQPEALVAADARGNVALAIGTQVRFLQRVDAGLYVVHDLDGGAPGAQLLVDSDGPYLVDDRGIRGLRLSGMDATYVQDGGLWLAGGTRDEGLFLVEGTTLRGWGSNGAAFVTVPDGVRSVAIANCVYATNGNGLWVQAKGTVALPSALTTTAWPNSSCATTTDTFVESALMRVGGRARAVLAFSGWRYTGPVPIIPRPRNFVSVLDVTRLSDPPRSDDPPNTGVCVLPPDRNKCGAARITELLDCGVPCDVGDRLTDLRPGDQAVEVECTGPLGQTTWSMRYDGECAAEPLTGTSSRFREQRTPGESSVTATYLVQRGPHGQVWFGDGISRAQPLVLDEPATGVLKLPAATGSQHLLVATRYSTRLDTRLGLVAMPSPEALAYVSGADALAVLKGGNVSELAQAEDGTLIVSERRAALDVFPEDLQAPVTAVLGKRGTENLLIVAVNERVYAAGENSWGRKVPLRLLPQPGFSVNSIALLPGSGTTVTGFLSTRVGVFKFSSSTEQQWEAWPIPLPPGQLVESWSDQGRARVGYADGRVLTLPSGVLLTRPGERAEVVDYLGVCGQVLALTRTGVVRLDETGRWDSVALTGGEVVLGDTLGGGRLLEKDGTIYVFNGSGGALTFRLSGGCP